VNPEINSGSPSIAAQFAAPTYKGGAMLFQVKNNRPATVNPQLSRVWIKTGNPRMPLKSVWINEAKLRTFADRGRAAARECEQHDLAEDHLLLAA
jgi:hypothetical protein